MVRALFTLQRARITDDPPDEAVIVRMSSGSEAIIQTRVELVFPGSWKSPGRNVNSQAPESRGGNENEQGEIGEPILRQVGKPAFDQVLARQ